MAAPPRTIAMLPTYNEAENIGPLIDALLALGPWMEVLVVDDHSPDGTWEIVDRLAQANPRVHLLLRKRDRGRGLAGIAGFREALRLGAEAVVEMDADWSHDPKWIPSMLEAFDPRPPIGEGIDIVIGSRLVPGGGEEGRHWTRPLITRAANYYIRSMLDLPVRDATSGYRLFSRRCLEALPWEAMDATGPEVVQEVLLAAHSRGFRIAEVPIRFVERRHGQSTFNTKIMAHSLAAMARLRWVPGRLVPPHYHLGKADQLTPLPSALSIPLSWGYRIGRWTDRQMHLRGLLARRRLPVRVVCVGNLSVGGTGKSPFVAMLANQLAGAGLDPAILSRGYRAQIPPHKPLLVSDGGRVLASADVAGDEPRMLAEACPKAAVIVHPNRHRAGQMALRLLGADILVLDDGFQHDELERDLDLVLWDLRDEPRRMRLLPAGRLREGLSALRRAGAIVLTHGEYLFQGTSNNGAQSRIDEHRRKILYQLKRAAPGLPVFEAMMEIVGYRYLSSRHGASELDFEEELGEETDSPVWPWAGKRVVAVSGLARPEGFEATLRNAGADVVRHFAYADHHTYHLEEVGAWREALERLDADLVLTTAKDAVKLGSLPLGGLPVVTVQVEMRITEPGRWEGFLAERLGIEKI